MANEPLQYGCYYHIYNRGNNSENLFRQEENYRYFLKLYAKYILPVADTFAYCLLPNHFHLLVQIRDLTGSPNLSGLKALKPSQQFSNLFNAYTKAVNKHYQRHGALFERPFKRIPVASERYFAKLVAYIHQNPQRHGLIDDFRQWPYSSYKTLFSEKPTHLNRDVVLGWFGGQKGVERLHKSEIRHSQPDSLLLEDFD